MSALTIALRPLSKKNMGGEGGGEGRGEESDNSHHYSTPAFQNKYEGRGGGGK